MAYNGALRNLGRKRLRGPHEPFLSGSAGEVLPGESWAGVGGHSQRLPWAQVRVGGFHLQVCMADAYFLKNPHG